MEKIFLYLLALFILIPVVTLASVFVTGRVYRSYPVLADDSKIEINGKWAEINEHAEKYIPFMYKQEAVITPPLLWVWYNAVDMGDKIDFVYYNVWENEINPNPLVHRYYSFFRAFYYGYPLYDIEYVQITVSKLNGYVLAFMFETGPSNDYYSIFNEHLVVKAEFISDGDYAIQIINRDTRKEMESFIDKPQFDNMHVKLGVQTWNHLSALMLPSNATIYTQEVPHNRLKYLSNTEYAKYKFVRKSQGDHITRENKLNILISSIAIFVFVTLPATLLSGFKKH